MKNKSIQIQEKHHKDLQKLSESLGQSYGKLVEKMILYFKRTGVDPDDTKNESPSSRIQQLDKRLVSFLRVQERDILKPLRQETYEYYTNQNEIIEKLHSSIINGLNKLNDFDIERNEKLNSELAKQEKLLIAICEHLDPKNKKGLKTSFQKIFKNAN